MEKERLEQIRFRTKFEIVKDSIVRINPEFSLCTVLVAYHGDNRNRSSISKEVFEKCLWTIYGIPIVGEWVRPEEDPGKETWGSHGGRIIWDDNGLRYEQTTKPFGFVTEEAYKNAKWVEVLEKDGHTKHEYLKLEKCILWNSRYEECDSILEENFGQSMEITVNKSRWRDDNYVEIDEFTFSALCILGTAEPCFESAMIGRQYELNQFKTEVQTMMAEYKRFNLEGSADKESPNLDNEPQKNFIEKEDTELDKIVFSDVCAKINLLMAEKIFRHNNTNKQYGKYIVLSIIEGEGVIVVDREENYSAYKIPYIATQTKEGLIVNFEEDKKVSVMIGAVDKTDAAFNVQAEVEMMAKDTSEHKVSVYSNTKINELMGLLNEKTVLLEAAHNTIADLEKHVNIFEKDKEQFEEQKHRSIIDALIAARRQEMGSYSEFLEYCIQIDYGKTVDEIEQELKDIHYNFMVQFSSGKKTFSAIEIPVTNANDSEHNSLVERYGPEVADILKK